MNLFERVKSAARAFVLGPSLFPGGSSLYVADDLDFQSPAYADYIATSNGVYACATLRAQMLASLPLKLFRVRANGDRVEVQTGPLAELLSRVNPRWTWNRLVQMSELSLCLWGETFWFLERGASGRQPPSEIWWGRSDYVSVYPDTANYVRAFGFHPYGIPEQLWTPDEVIWIRYPNPANEFEGLSPLAAARLAADYSSAAMKSNRNLFANGMQLGGVVSPKGSGSGTALYTPEQAKELEEQLARRFQGVDKAHRWGVLRFEADFKNVSFTPAEAEFLGGLKWSLEDICRAYKVPIDLIGGERTYENYAAAQRAMWEQCVLPEAALIAAEINEQLLPLFPGAGVDEVQFVTDEIGVLQEGENDRWMRAREQISAGAITINEWRAEMGLSPVAWGDVWWAPMSLSPITDESRELQGASAGGVTAIATVEDEGRQHGQRVVEFGSLDHQRLWNRFVRRTGKYEELVARVVRRLFERLRDSVMELLRARAQRDANDVLVEPFDMSHWQKVFRQAIRAVLLEIAEDMGNEALDDLGLAMAFDVYDPGVIRFLEARSQRFATQVLETTWNELKASLGDGIAAGESIPELAKRVDEVMGDRIRSSATVIARTETIGAANGATLLAWQQSNVVKGKEWLAALDERTRETHIAAHGQRVGINELFTVGNGRGPSPGQIGLPEEDIQCRCTMLAVLE